jgi:hypothetical protein
MKVVCILGMVHSGTTVLDLVLGGHPRFVGLGELSAFVDSRRGDLGHLDTQLCSCRRVLKDCPFWGPFSAELVRRSPTSESARYEMLLSAFGGHFGEDQVLVDSSKTVATVQAWTELVGKENVRVLLLVRDVRGWVTSMIDLDNRRGEYGMRDLLTRFHLGGPKEFARRSVLNRFRQWYRGNRRLQEVLEQNAIGTFQLSYERLCLFPESTLDDLCRFLGVQPVLQMLSLRESGSHVVLGNRMKGENGTRQGVRYDGRWFTRREWILPAALLPAVMRYNAREVYGKVEVDPRGGPPESLSRRS